VNAFFTAQERLAPTNFEAKLFLGEIKAIPQDTPAVTDADPVVRTLKNNNIAVLRNHGTVAVGKSLFDCFLLVQALEEAAKIDVLSQLYKSDVSCSSSKNSREAAPKLKKYKLFSEEQISEIVRLVNEDKQMKELGAKTAMTMDLAVKLDESGCIYSFHFENGKLPRLAVMRIRNS